MKKYVIYTLPDHSIVRLTDERPSFETIPINQDWDSVENWMAVDKYADKINRFLKVNNGAFIK